MITWQVPGRIEILGKHTDYAGGRVLVCAVERAVTVKADFDSCSDGVICAKTTAFDDSIQLTAGESNSLPAGHWGNYVQTVIDRLSKNFGPLKGAQLEISSDLPPASGMSSSSAVLTAVALALADLNGFSETELWKNNISSRLDLAGFAASIENGKAFKDFQGLKGVGTSGGSLDHTGMLTSEVGLLSYAEFDPMRIIERVPEPEGYSIVVGVSGVLAEKTGTAKDLYNRGPQTLGQILKTWNEQQGRNDESLTSVVRHLLGADVFEPLEPSDERLEPLRAVAEDGYPKRRLHQFLEESTVLVPAAVKALKADDIDSFADVVAQSHQLAITHLENQVPATIELVELAKKHGAKTASAFGAGFGGSTWALVKSADAEEFAAAWLAEYKSKFDTEHANTIITKAGPSAKKLS